MVVAVVVTAVVSLALAWAGGTSAGTERGAVTGVVPVPVPVAVLGSGTGAPASASQGAPAAMRVKSAHPAAAGACESATPVPPVGTPVTMVVAKQPGGAHRNERSQNQAPDHVASSLEP